METENMYNGLNNNILMNYGGCQMGGYQYGMGIADLFSGVNGLNSIWNFNNCGFSNIGYGCGCGNSNNALGWGIGYTLTNILGNIGLSWIASARANKAAEKKAEKEAAEKQQQSVENAFKCVFGNDTKTLNQLLDMDASQAKQEVKDKNIVDEYNDSALKNANDILTNKKTNLKTAQDNLTSAQNTTKQAKDAYDKLQSSDTSYNEKRNAYKEAVKAEEKAENKVKEMQQEVKEAQDEVNKITKAREAFEDAKKVLIDKIEANDKVKKAENKKKAETDEKQFKDLADDADGCDLTVNKKVKQYNNRYDQAGENGIKQLKSGQTATIDDLRAIAHLTIKATPEKRIKLKKQFDEVMKNLNIEVENLPDDLRRFYNEGLSKYVEQSQK